MQQSHQTGHWIWTDFLCLNQKKSNEMDQKVPRVGLIYSEALRAISWLGSSRGMDESDNVSRCPHCITNFGLGASPYDGQEGGAVSLGPIFGQNLEDAGT